MKGLNRRWFLGIAASLSSSVSWLMQHVPGFAQGGPAATTAKTSGAGGDRLEPLFLSEADARDVIRTHCTTEAATPIDQQQVDFLISRLRPQFWIAPSMNKADTPGATRLGGAPDFPKNATWPERPAFPEMSQRAADEKHGSPWIVRQLSEKVPFEFVGQINLAEAARHPKHAEGLPASGRLLFFVDIAMLMHAPSGGTEACLVLHDETPVAELWRMPAPTKFTEMDAWWRAPDPKSIAIFKEMVKNLEASGQKESAQAMRDAVKSSENPDPKSTKPFLHPPRAMELKPLWVLPRQNSADLTLDPELSAFAQGDDTSGHYEILTSHDTGPFTSDKSGMRRTQTWALIQARQQRFMGPPDPEQDDPRFDVLEKAALPPYPWDPDQIEYAARMAMDWHLLLQCSLADLSQIVTEGTVYFLIHKDDLAKRDFTRTAVVYQQT